MTFVDAITTCFRKALTFSGRAARAEFWWFMVFYFAFVALAGFLDAILFPISLSESSPNISPLMDISTLALTLPVAAAGARRLQDTGFHGWPSIATQIMAAVYLVTLWLNVSDGMFYNILLWGGGLLNIILLVACLYPSQPRDNRFGPPPR